MQKVNNKVKSKAIANSTIYNLLIYRPQELIKVGFTKVSVCKPITVIGASDARPLYICGHHDVIVLSCATL